VNRFRRTVEWRNPSGVGTGSARQQIGGVAMVAGVVVGIGLETLAMVIAAVGRDIESGEPGGGPG